MERGGGKAGKNRGRDGNKETRKMNKMTRNMNERICHDEWNEKG
jgi:hypothetical protein